MKIDPPTPEIIDGKRCFEGAAWGAERKIQITANECLIRESAVNKARENLHERVNAAELELEQIALDFHTTLAEKEALAAAVVHYQESEAEAREKARQWCGVAFAVGIFGVVVSAILFSVGASTGGGG